MNQDIKKFEELLRTDKSVQKKLQEAIAAYSGDTADEKGIFDSVILPIAKEAGLSATFEEFQVYLKQINVNAPKDGADLNADELSQVAGGGKAGGIGGSSCMVIGVGIGGGAGKGGGGLCMIVGVGWENVHCEGEGVAEDI